jgi:predicted metal-dependent phosphoesterase TrpH
MTDRRRKLDLHVHTREGSPCAQIPARDVLRLAARQGLDGVAFTDHHHPWPPAELERVRRESGVSLLVLSGQEITFQGVDFLVFGWEGDPSACRTREAFAGAVRREGGVVLVAHPYSVLYYLDAETMAAWGVNGVEVLNTLKGGPAAGERAEVAARGLAEVGGSDFHRPVFRDALGNCWTEVPGDVDGLPGLLAAVRERRTVAVGAGCGPA